MKKALATLMAVMMVVLTMTSTVFAVPTQPVTKIVITNEPTVTGIHLEGKVFEVYKLFDATVDNSGTEGQISYELAPKYIGFFEDVLGMAYNVDDHAAFDAAAEQYIHDVYDNKGNNGLQELTKALNTAIAEGTIASDSTISGSVASSGGIESMASEDLLPGYYLVLDKTPNATITAGMLVQLPSKGETGLFDKNTTIKLKGSQPEIDKEILHNENNEWGTVGDHQIGDTVNFRIECKLPTDLTGYYNGTVDLTKPDGYYEYYKYVVTDTLSEGVDFNKDSLQLYFDKEMTKPVLGNHHKQVTFDRVYDPVTGEMTNGKIFEVTLDMIAIKELNLEEDVCYIGYTGTLNEKSVIATDFEKNEVTLDYSNNPFDTESFGKDEDVVYNYTFGLDITKTDATLVNTLAGAKFGLFKSASDGKPEEQVFLNPELDAEGNKTGTYIVTKTAPTNVEDSYIVTDETGKFFIKGLDDSIAYILREIEAPAGYTKAEDIHFTIGADYGDGTVPNVTLTKQPDNFEVVDGVVTGKVINTSSELFPGTGGSGTTMFIIVGCVFMVGAAVVFLAMRKKSTNK